jgi:hypothetical protein
MEQTTRIVAPMEAVVSFAVSMVLKLTLNSQRLNFFNFQIFLFKNLQEPTMSFAARMEVKQSIFKMNFIN